VGACGTGAQARRQRLLGNVLAGEARECACSRDLLHNAQDRAQARPHRMSDLASEDKVHRWHVPLSRREVILAQARAELVQLGIRQQDVPFLVQLVENPRYDLPGIDIFHGATDLATHDQIHILLGRGLLSKDEAFVVGFTMGSTDRVSQTEETLYGIFARYLYPRGYRFSETDMRVFRDAVRLGFVSDCVPLNRVRWEDLQTHTIGQARAALGIEEDLLRAYYAIERNRYPESPESQRLLD